MLKLRRLKIHQYRNVRPGSELYFGDGINLVLGLSGSGKTTLLDLVVRLLSKPLNKIDDDNNYHLEVELVFNTRRVFGWISQTTSSTEQDAKQITAKLSMQIDGNAALYQINYDGENLNVEPAMSGDSAGKHMGGSSLLDLVRQSYLLATEDYVFFSLSEEALLGPEYRYEEGLETLSRIEQAVHRIDHIPNLGPVIFNHQGWTIPCLMSAIFDIAKNRPNDTEIHIESSSQRGAFLRTFVELTGLAAVTMRLDRIEKRMSGKQSYNLIFGNLRFLIKHHDGSEHYHQTLSRGQKRLLSYLYYCEANRDIIVADELVNDLHYSWIEKCIDLISPRQAFLTSQNPLLLDHLVFHSQEEIQRSFVLCERIYIGEDGRETLILRNPNDTEAAAFYRAYEAGVQYVSEILRSKGLW